MVSTNKIANLALDLAQGFLCNFFTIKDTQTWYALWPWGGRDRLYVHE